MIPAVVSDRNRSNIIYCLICDASRSGCRLKSNDLSYIPDDVYIKVEKLKEPIRGKVVWRSNGMAGIQFFWDTPEIGDARGHHRLETDFTAVISDRGETLQLPCIIKNASGSGCMVSTDRIAELPDAICIKFDATDPPLAGQIVWRNGDTAGVSFTWDGTTENDGEEGNEPGDVPFYI